jgi:hypothetical protein
MKHEQKRTMYQLCLKTGDIRKVYLNSSCTLARYLSMINVLNRSANIYACVYLPDVDCGEYVQFVSEV